MAPHAQWRKRLSSAADTERLGRVLGRLIRGGAVFAFYGELGTGKTTLIRGLAKGLGVPADRVTSPSFVLMHEYRGRLPLVHADLYRLGSVEDLQHVGLMDRMDGQTVVAVEWAGKAGCQLPEDRLEVQLTHRTPSTRDALLLATGPSTRDLLTRVKAHYRRRRTPARPKARRTGR